MTNLTRRHALGALSASLMALGGCATPSPQRESAVASEGDTLPEEVRMVIPYAEAGGTDVWARFVAPYLTAEMSRSCNITPENLPGGESIVGSNRYAREDVNDGSQVLVSSGTTYFQYLVGRPEVEFDFAKLRPLVLSATGGVIYGSRELGVTSIDDLFSGKASLRYGGISATGLDLSALLAFQVLGLDVKTVFGLEGRGPARLAVERGELSLDYQTTTAYLTQVTSLVDDGRVVPLMSFGQLDADDGLGRDAQLPDLPSVGEVYQDVHGSTPSGLTWEAYKTFLGAGFSYQKGLWVPADTPDSVVAPFFEAARALVDNDEFHDEGEEVLGGYPIFPGDEVEDQVRETLAISTEVQDHVLDILEDQYDTVIDSA